MIQYLRRHRELIKVFICLYLRCKKRVLGFVEFSLYYLKNLDMLPPMISFTFFIKIDLMLYIPGPGAHVASCMLGTGSLSWG